jgi:hypothetical protein
VRQALTARRKLCAFPLKPPTSAILSRPSLDDLVERVAESLLADMLEQRWVLGKHPPCASGCLRVWTGTTCPAEAGSPERAAATALSAHCFER